MPGGRIPVSGRILKEFTVFTVFMMVRMFIVFSILRQSQRNVLAVAVELGGSVSQGWKVREKQTRLGVASETAVAGYGFKDSRAREGD